MRHVSVQKVATEIQKAGFKVIASSPWADDVDGLVELEGNYSVQVGIDYVFLNHEDPITNMGEEFEDADTLPKIIEKLKSLKSK